jgi:hypothetical protein
MSATLWCAILGFVDGDTVRLRCEAAGEIVLRLQDVDAPESDGRARCPQERAAGRAAAAHAHALLGPFEGEPGAIVEVTVAYADRWGRQVGRAVIRDGLERGQDLAAALAATARAQGLEALRPWPFDGRGRAMAPRPDWCAPGASNRGERRGDNVVQ